MTVLLEHPWLESVPADWRVARLKTTVGFSQNGLWGDEPDGVNDIVCVRVADFDRVRCRVVLADPTTRSIPAAKIGRRLLKRGDLLIEKSGGGEHQPVGTVVKYDHDVRAVCSNFVARIEPKAAFDSGFLCYLHAALYVLRVPHRSIKQTTGIQNLDAESYFDEPVPLPPTKVQQRIAAFLDRRTAAIDALIAKKERQVELLQEKQQAFITQAMTKGLDHKVPTKNSGIEWMGHIPRHWGVKRLRHISPRIGVGVVVSPSQYVSVAGVPFLYGADVGEGFLRAQDARRISPGDSRRLAVSQLHAGDLVTIRVGATRGWTAVIPPEFEGANCASIMITRRHSSFCSDWLCLAMNSRLGMAQIEAIEYGAAQPQFNISHATEFWFPVPPFEEQRAIASTLLSFQGDDRKQQALVGASIERLREYRQALITAAVTGKLDVSKEAA